MENVTLYTERTITDHRRSILLLERLGFKKIEMLKENTENKGIKADRFRYELIL